MDENTVSNTKSKTESKKLIDMSTQTDMSLNPMNFVYRNDNREPTNLINNITTNWIFYIVLIISCIILSLKSEHIGKSFILNILSIIFVSFLGYFIHFFSHFVSFSELYTSSNNYLQKNCVTDMIFKYICKFMDFHDKTHHNTSINKEPINILYEFINNIFFQGGILLFFIYISKSISISSIILWMFYYATVHNINYLLMPCKTHQNHHINKFTSYGLDIWDIIFNTSYDENEVENYNHSAINMLFISLVLYYFL
jgi:hypothetical protein